MWGGGGWGRKGKQTIEIIENRAKGVGDLKFFFIFWVLGCCAFPAKSCGLVLGVLIEGGEWFLGFNYLLWQGERRVLQAGGGEKKSLVVVQQVGWFNKNMWEKIVAVLAQGQGDLNLKL